MTLKISANQLSLGTHYDDVVCVQQPLQGLRRTIPVAERRVLRAGTAAVLKALQADRGLPDRYRRGRTIRAINVKLSQLATDLRVRSSVRDANRNPFTNGSLEIFSEVAAQTKCRWKHRLAVCA